MVLWARIGGALLALVLLLAPLAASGAETSVLTLKQLTVMALDSSNEVKATKSEVTRRENKKMRSTATAGRNSTPLPPAVLFLTPVGARCVRSAKTKPSSTRTPKTSFTG